MAEKTYLGIGDVAHKVSKGYLGVDALASKLKKIYLGDALGVARLVFCSTVYLEAIPELSGSLTYTGEVLSPTWRNYDPEALAISGDTSATNAGDYATTFTPNEGYCWSDGSVDPKTIAWSVAKAEGSVAVSSDSVILDDTTTEVTVTVLTASNGAITASSSDETVAVATITDGVMTISTPTLSRGTAIITVSVAAGSNHLACSAQIYVEAVFAPKVVALGAAAQLRTGRYMATAAANSKYTIAVGGRDSSSNSVLDGEAFDEQLTRRIIAEHAGGDIGTHVGDYALFGGSLASTAYDTELTMCSASKLTGAQSRAAATTSYAVFAGDTTSNVFDKDLTLTTVTDGGAWHDNMCAVSVGGYAIFAGGCYDNLSDTTPRATVWAIDDTLTYTKPTALSTARQSIRGARAGEYAIIGGGTTSYSVNPTGTCEAYDSTLTKVATTLSMSVRTNYSAVTLADRALFVGGYQSYATNKYLDVAEMFTTSLTRHTLTPLSVGRDCMAAAVIGNTALFMGGETSYSVCTDAVDVYTYR